MRPKRDLLFWHETLTWLLQPQKTTLLWRRKKEVKEQEEQEQEEQEKEKKETLPSFHGRLNATLPRIQKWVPLPNWEKYISFLNEDHHHQKKKRWWWCFDDDDDEGRIIPKSKKIQAVHSLAMNEYCHSSSSSSSCINQKKKSCKSALLITHKIDYQICWQNKPVITTVLQRWVCSQSNWINPSALLMVVTSPPHAHFLLPHAAPNFFIYFLVLFFFGDGSWTAAGWINAMQLLP